MVRVDVEGEITLEMKKVVTVPSPPLPKDQLDKLISAVIQEEGSKWSLEWALNDDRTRDIYRVTEKSKGE